MVKATPVTVEMMTAMSMDRVLKVVRVWRMVVASSEKMECSRAAVVEKVSGMKRIEIMMKWSGFVLQIVVAWLKRVR